jgi:amidase
MTIITDLHAEALSQAIHARELSCRELMAAYLARIHRFNPRLNAIVNLAPDDDVLALPVTQVWPFPVEQRWLREIAGRAMDSYHRWMEVTLYATFAGLPGLSLPAGFHANGRWPAGLQLIGRPQGELALLRVAAAYESLIGDWLLCRPAEPV